MYKRMKPAVLLIAIYSGIGLSLTSCAVGVTPTSEPAITAPGTESSVSPTPATVPEMQPALTGNCSAVDEKSVRSACFQHAPSSRMCQPQSIPYARCRSHISSCNLGNTSPVQLFNCEQQRGYTSPLPQAGALMSIGVNRTHHMSTGHTLYVEEVCPNPDGTYKLRVSHTNYNRKCHLEEDAWVHYDPQRQYADFNTGHWATWGKHLPVQGFILREPVNGKDATTQKPTTNS